MDLLALGVTSALILALVVFILTTNDLTRPAPPTAATLYDGSAPDAVPLIAHASALRGWPTAVERATDGTISVIWARPGTAPTIAASSDLVRLAGDMFVAEEALGVTVTTGVLRYQDRSLKIPFTALVRDLIAERIAELRAADGDGPNITGQDAATCHACAYRSMCAIGTVMTRRP